MKVIIAHDYWIRGTLITGNPGSVIVPQYGSSKITVFVWGKNTILKFLGNTKYNNVFHEIWTPTENKHARIVVLG